MTLLDYLFDMRSNCLCVSFIWRGCWLRRRVSVFRGPAGQVRARPSVQHPIVRAGHRWLCYWCGSVWLHCHRRDTVRRLYIPSI